MIYFAVIGNKNPFMEGAHTIANMHGQLRDLSAAWVEAYTARDYAAPDPLPDPLPSPIPWITPEEAALKNFDLNTLDLVNDLCVNYGNFLIGEPIFAENYAATVAAARSDI